MAITLTRQSAKSKRLTYLAVSDGAHAVPADTITQSNATLLADYIALYAGYLSSPLYQALLATYATIAALGVVMPATAAAVWLGPVRTFIRHLAPATWPGTYVAGEQAEVAAVFGISATPGVPTLIVTGPPISNATNNPWSAFIDIEYDWSATGT